MLKVATTRGLHAECGPIVKVHLAENSLVLAKRLVLVSCDFSHPRLSPSCCFMFKSYFYVKPRFKSFHPDGTAGGNQRKCY